MDYAKLNRRRNCLKGRMNRLCQDLDALIRQPESRIDVKMTLDSISKLLERCQEAQDAVEAVITDDDEIEKETQRWMDFEREIRSVRGRAERYLETNTEPVDSKKSSLNSASAKLPTWSILKFTGKVLDFPSFWEQFNAGIHDNAELADVTKFIYLRSLLEGEGLKAIDGYAVTQDNYPIARQALVSRFGNPKRVIEHHIQAIADLRPNGDRTFRELHDELVTHVRSLRALNRDTLGNQFASDIILTLCKRLLPKKILSLWEDKILESEDDPNEVETFFVFLHKHAEIEARVHQDNHKYGRRDGVEIKKKEHRHSNKVLSTSVAPGNLCSICQENHHAEGCPLFLKATRPERWTLAKKYRLCFRCLRQGHRSTDCKRSHNSRNVTSVGLHRLLSEDRNVRAAEENCTPHGDERSEKSPETTPTDVSEPTNAVRVCANRTRDTRDRTYLQTAKAYLYTPNGNYTEVMCLFYTGSQRSFVTKGIADSLGLTGLSERVCISTLGNNTCHKKLRRVSFSLKGITPNSQAKQINAYCVNRICDTLEENPPAMWEHAKDLNLADDFPRGRCDVDVLIGIDYYYHFIEDDRRCVVDEWLVALRSTLGWILCGQDSRTNYTDTVKVMRIDVRPRCDCEKHHRFGELKSIGIMDQPETESPAERNDILLSCDDELAALVSARLVTYVGKQLSIEIDEIVCWSDSEVAPSWIKSPAVKWKTCVRNRVESIQQLTEASVWRYCPTGENPADMLSRGCSLKSLEESQLWWEGPLWLSLPVDNWPKKSVRVDQSKITSSAEARNKITTLAVSVIEKNDRLEPSRFSNFEKLVRVTAFCFRFFRNLQLPRHERKFAELTVEELAKAENFWLLTVQPEAFEKELAAVQSGKNPEGKLARFNPYLDANGLLRVGGRLQNSDMDAERKHPILLPSTHPVVMLLIKRVHERSLHAGTEQTLTDLRQRFWVLKGRSSVKRIVRQCRICKRQSARPYEPIMNDLPIDRVTVAAPFERIGIDIAGPVYIKMRNNHVKTYICLFTCMVRRAIHLELVTSMTTKQFLNAFHRFAARRGYPVLVQSDNFKTFKQADQELRYLFSENQWSEIRAALTVNRIKWKYITERAPWNGGYWERIVRTVKESLKKVLGNTRLEEDELRTVLCEIEARINSRPLTF
ncbi:putative integrase core domain protein, partial [Trichinella spiralis]|uniref:putative integrase core domain protein n=1 Tax=Trichinella spiralis TaxID=6334 RepID=UPI0001EFBD99